MIAFSEQYKKLKFIIEEDNSQYYLYIESPDKGDSKDYVYDTLEGAKHHASYDYKVDPNSWKETPPKIIKETTISRVTEGLGRINITQDEASKGVLPIILQIVAYEDEEDINAYITLKSERKIFLKRNISLDQLIHDLKEDYQIEI